MEYVCDYCKKSYLPKRADSLYCSHSCRQLAYVLRKASADGLLRGLEFRPNDEKPELASTDTELPVKTGKNLSVKTDEEVLAVNTEYDGTSSAEKDLVIRMDNQISANSREDLSVKTVKEILSVKSDKDKTIINKVGPEQEYEELNSSYLAELEAIYEQSNNWLILGDLFGQKNEAAMWVSERFRCLTECLLAFTEMRYIEPDDLKELCNAFTDLIRSRYFKCLPQNYPYIVDIQELRELIKRACLKAGHWPQIAYRLTRGQKQNLIVTRFELAQFVPKRKFRELKFRVA